MCKNVLVTGGAGFVGSNLCAKLIQNGYTVNVVDNYSTGSVENHVDGVCYHNMDTRDILQLKIDPPDIIYHLGEYSRVEQSFDDFDKVWEYNISGTHKVLEYARINKSKLIYAGSSTKFGDIGSNSSPYAWSKSSNTTLVKNYAEWFGLEYAITYFYNNYGPNEISTGPYATLIAKLKDLYLHGEKFGITSPGTQLRNFTHVDDTVAGLILVGSLGYGDDYGIGHHDAYSILDVQKMFGCDFEMLPEKRGNRLSAPVLTDKIKALGWVPKKNLKTYISEIVNKV
jgi:UDP-glucose 4-epimerase